MPLTIPAVCTAFLSKNSYNLCKILRLLRGLRKNIIICWPVPAWVLWPHREYVDEQLLWEEVLWSQLCFACSSSAVATEYFANRLMFLKQMEICLHLKEKIIVYLCEL